jgi:anaerobic selenocysteine-containing dehydrogenase
MTNHWNDIDNASLVFAFGANPAENHPACMAHINAARFGNGKNAKLIVVDPRLTRTARQCDPNRGDKYVRIRPGTNVAFSNGLLKWIFDNIATYDSAASDNMLAWHNGTAANSLSSARAFINDAGVSKTLSSADTLATASYDGSTYPLATGYPKYCDTRFLVNAAANDYQRGTLTLSASGGTISNFPVIAPSVTAQVGGLDTVWTSLQQHLAPYTTATVADICGCSEGDIALVAQALIDNSRFKSSDFGNAIATPQATGYKATTILYAMGQTQFTNGSQNIKDLAVMQTLMGNMGRAGGGINALRGIHNVQGSTDMGLLFDSIPAYSGNPGVGTTWQSYLNPLFGNRVVGNTAVNKAAATLTPNGANSGLTYTAVTAGAAGNSITVTYVNPGTPSAALDVTVAGSAITVSLATDAGSLVTSTANLVLAAVNADVEANLLVVVAKPTTSDGTALVSATGPTSLTGGRDAATDISMTPALLGLQQRGFFNMTTEWFGKGTSSGADVVKLYDLWPKGNGVQHIETFRKMSLGLGDANRIISSVVWGQNPAVTEPNQSKVREGLKNLDLLVVVDMYETETAACDRKAGGITYLIPACSHVEEAGSVTNSGRWLQWRERATAPKGNSKADLELLLRFAYALDKAGAFSHITNVKYLADGTVSPVGGVPTGGVWSTLSSVINGPAYKVLYGDKFGWTPDAVPGSFEATSVTTERWEPGASAPINTYAASGSEVIAERIFIEICRPLADTATSGGTMWIYSGAAPAGAYSTSLTNYNPICKNADGTAVNWVVKNKAKSRNNVYKGASTGALGDTTVANANANNYPRWGWAWLLNRRVFYNNSEVAADQADTFVSPGLISCTFTQNANYALADFSAAYRAYKKFVDAPSTTTGPHFVSAGKTFMGRFPGHTEPYESPREDIVTLYGHNMSGTSRLIFDVVTPGDAGTPIGTVATYPLVLTSIRCVEHFQGGPTTRNNSWNVEAEPVPWIEINSIDARANGISDGDWVNVITARSNSTTDEKAETPANTANWARGFKARVGVGVQTNQRVGVGVVAIPWHWGDKGLSTGSRANDLCIDAWDANTMIPEYKVCLCRIVKL